MRSLYKIVHTSCSREWGEDEQRILNESLWMSAKGHQMVIVAPRDAPLYDRAKGYGFNRYPMSFTRLGVIRDYKRLVGIFENEQPHILNTHGNRDASLALGAAKKAGVSCRILSSHGTAPVRNTWGNRRLYKRLSHYVFTSTQQERLQLKSLFKLKGMEIFSIPTGITPPPHLMPKTGAGLALAQELGLAPDTRFIGFVGPVSREKGVDILLRAFKRAALFMDHHLVIVGTGEPLFLDQLSTLSETLGIEDRIHFMGPKKNRWPYYRAFDCKVMASRERNGSPVEGVPTTLLEAMYSQCPVIASRTGEVQEIITHEKTGLLFEQEDEQDLSRRILQTLNQETATRNRVIDAQKQIQKQHTLDAMGRDIIRIYRLHQVKLEKQFMA